MRANRMVELLGNDLIGENVLTEQVGEYPGGYAVVTEIAPDPAALEIAFNVRHPIYGEVGVFGHETVKFAQGKQK